MHVYSNNGFTVDLCCTNFHSDYTLVIFIVSSFFCMKVPNAFDYFVPCFILCSNGSVKVAVIFRVQKGLRMRNARFYCHVLCWFYYTLQKNTIQCFVLPISQCTSVLQIKHMFTIIWEILLYSMIWFNHVAHLHTRQFIKSQLHSIEVISCSRVVTLQQNDTVSSVGMCLLS